MSFQQGLSGLNAAAANLNAIGNNVANASTVGFKSSGVVFADVYASATGASSATSIGLGTAIAAVQGNFGQGNLRTTSNPLDVAINGSGFFRLDTNGTISYTRNGQFHLDKDGYMVNATGSMVTGYGVDAQGNVLVANPSPLQISSAQIPASATTAGTIGMNLDSRESTITATFDMTNARTYNKATSLTVYDSLGTAHSLTTYYVKSAANSWKVYSALDNTQIGTSATGTLTFGTDGVLASSAPAQPFSLTFTPTGAAAQTVTLDLSTATQFASAFSVDTLTQDGAAAGQLSGYGIDKDGTIVGRYSNGQTKTLGQLMLSNFKNPNGLQPLGNNGYAETSASGQPVPGAPGTSNFGIVQSGALEESNVDLTAELVDMITAQRVYQANAQTIKTQDQVLNTLVNMR